MTITTIDTNIAAEVSEMKEFYPNINLGQVVSRLSDRYNLAYQTGNYSSAECIDTAIIYLRVFGLDNI